jgi:hypothetical protein
MAANLRQKDLLVVGFWSDWDYLNAVLGSILEGIAPLSVTVVDMANEAALRAKAPDLWTLAHGDNVTFTHVQASGADALDALRKAFSNNFLRAVLEAGRTAFEQIIDGPLDPAWLEIPDFDTEVLYGLRRDAEGIPNGKPAMRLQPGACEILGTFHLMLRRAGAIPTAPGYQFGGRSIRVVNGAASILSQIKARFVEAPVVAPTDIVVAAGAINLPVPANIIRSGQPGSFMRPAAPETWFDLLDARAELGI